MNIVELKKWAEEKIKTDRVGLLSDGVSDNKTFKAMTFLKEIVNHCNKIAFNTESNNKSINEIERYIKLLTDYGLTVDKKDKYKEEKVDPLKSNVR